MPLSEDQRALLGLLLAGDDYEQVAAVLGTSSSQVRTKAREAAARLEAEKADDLSAAAVRQRLRELDQPPGAAPVPAGPAPSRRSSGLPRALWLLMGAGIAVLLVVLGVTLLGGGSEEAAQGPRADQEDATVIRLSPVGGGRGSGTVTIGRVVDQPTADFDLRGLAPTGPGETYVVWLLGSGGRGLPIGFRPVGPDGRLAGRAAIPTAAIGLLPSFELIDVSLAQERQAAAAVRAAARARALPQHLGTTVLRGTLP
jgi:DNA-binding CsgD family transcriptional regulator